jgi:hypothetical protein
MFECNTPQLSYYALADIIISSWSSLHFDVVLYSRFISSISSLSGLNIGYHTNMAIVILM